jgi:serine/threonine protein kinase/WD40 repeat protein
MIESTPDRNPFELLAEEFADRLRRGEHPSLTEYVERYPEHADDIRELMPALALVEQFKPARQELNGSLAASLAQAGGEIPTQLGDYRILRYLGEGGMGVVYEAVRESLRSHVALKVMHPQYRNRTNYLRRFHTEARSAARLHHTNIVSVFDYGEHGGICYYAMQYIAGQSLDKVVDDIRELRDEQQKRSTGETMTLACHASSPNQDGDGAKVAHERLTTTSLDRSVTLGLLTGRFRSATASDTPGGEPIRSATEVTVVPAAEVGAYGATITLCVPQLSQSDATIRPNHGRIPTSPIARDRDGMPDRDQSGSLTGKADIRYYREVARLGAQVADALAYAHKRGVLHRDIKPPNLILDAMGNIWVTDFGLAKFEEGDDLSQSQDLVGTLRYMAPERFRGKSDRRGDVYALGATLYQLLTLRSAFEGDDQLRLIRQIENEPPVAPRQLDPKIPRDLETIVLKTLAKDPNDRFASADELAAELRRFIADLPIRSRPLPYYQRFWRWCKRNPYLAAANITAAALLTILAIVSTVAAFTYRDKNQRIEHAENETLRQLFGALKDRARAGRFSRRMGQRFDSLDALDKAARIARDLKLPALEFDSLRDDAIACMALPDLKPGGRVITRPAEAVQLAFDSAMTRYAIRFRDGTIVVRHYTDDHEIDRFELTGDASGDLFCFSPDGRYLAMTNDGALVVRDVDRRKVSVTDQTLLSWGHAAKFDPASRIIYVGHGDKNLLIYDLTTGQMSQQWTLEEPPSGLMLSHDGTEIAVVSNDKVKSTCRIFEADSGRLVRTIPLPSTTCRVAWSRDGSTLATPCDDAKIYLWNADTGAARGTLEGHSSPGIRASFDPSGALVASNAWEGGVRLWDTALGRQWLKVTGTPQDFSQDGRIVIATDVSLTTFDVDPALEYRTLPHPANPPLNYQSLSVHPDGRLLAAGTNRGVVLWDLEHGIELAFLPIGLAWATRFEPSGDLLTSGAIDVFRWPVRIGTSGIEPLIGPPNRVRLGASDGPIAQDRSGQIIALADHSEVRVMTPDRRFRIGPLDDCRSVAVSPDGQWIATGMHSGANIKIWRVGDGACVKELPRMGGVVFSPDGKWLMAAAAPCQLWSVDTWVKVRQIGDSGICFSPDSRLLVVKDANMILRLVETETGRTVARLESPDLCGVLCAVFSTDGTRLAVATNDGPSVHVWDLRAIRRNLSEMGLDYESPEFSHEDFLSTERPPIGRLRVDFGKLTGHLEHFSKAPAALADQFTRRIEKDHGDTDAYHHRAHALVNLQRYREAIADLDQAIRRRPDDAHMLSSRATIFHRVLKEYAPAIADLEAALACGSDESAYREDLALCCNNLAWELATGPVPARDHKRALHFAGRAVELLPGEGVYLNTLGVAQYRAGQYEQARATLERSLSTNRGKYDGFDLFFLAMTHHTLGQHVQARVCYDRAVNWRRGHNSLSQQDAAQLTAFQTEAESVLTGDLPVDVFAPTAPVPGR